MIALSVSYDMFIDDEFNNNADSLWFGLGIGNGRSWHVAIYSDYYNEISASLSLFFH